jgi:hypothetical protein
MTPVQFEYVGRFVNKLMPHISQIAFYQFKKNKPILTDFSEIKILLEVFSEFNNIEFPECTKNQIGRRTTEYRMKFVALYLYCYDPDAIRGPYFSKMKRTIRAFLSQSIFTSGSVISQYLPRCRFYLNKVKDFESDILQMVAMVKMRACSYNKTECLNDCIHLKCEQ